MTSCSSFSAALGLRQKIFTQDWSEYGFVNKATPPVQIMMIAGGRNAVDGPEDKQGV
jgi:hypothetical protein